MIAHRISLSVACGPADVALWLTKVSAEHGCVVGAPRPLRTVPRSTHWHLTREGAPGAVEVTHDLAGHAVLVIVHDNRCGTWAVTAATEIAASAQAGLHP